jgi:hypothetical protein
VINPKKNRYGCPGTDEFWTYAVKRKNKVRLIYAYHRESGEIAAYVRWKRDIKTAEKDKRVGDKLWPGKYGQPGEFSCGLRERRACGG